MRGSLPTTFLTEALLVSAPPSSSPVESLRCPRRQPCYHHPTTTTVISGDGPCRLRWPRPYPLLRDDDDDNDYGGWTRSHLRPPSCARPQHRDGQGRRRAVIIRNHAGEEDEETSSSSCERRDSSSSGDGGRKGGEEEVLRRMAADALLPVLFPNTTTTCNGDVRSDDAERALRRCLRRMQIPAAVFATNGDDASARRMMRRRLAELILGTSVMRLRHSYVLNATLGNGDMNMAGLMSNDDDDEETRDLLVSLLPPLTSVKNTSTTQAERAGGKRDESHEVEGRDDDGSDGPCRTSSSLLRTGEEEGEGVHADETDRRKRTIVRSMVDLHARYLSSEGISPSHSTTTDTESSKHPRQQPPQHSAVEWPIDPAERIAVQHSLPPFLARLLVDQYGEVDAERIAVVANRPGPITLRRNDIATVTRRMLSSGSGTGALEDHAIEGMSERRRRMLADDALCRRLLDEDGICAIPLNFPPGCIRVTSGRPRSVWATGSWRDGWFEVQDSASQMVVEATESKSGDVVVDYCAGNGGKTLAIASRMSTDGTIVAHDVREDRLTQLRGSLSHAGLLGGGASSVPWDGREGGRQRSSSSKTGEGGVTIRTTTDTGDIVPPGSADVVLVDAPCSSSGVLRRRPSHRWTLTEGLILRDLPALQLRILMDAARLVRGGGGRLVYATCSLIRCENEGVAEAFERSPDFGRDGWEPWAFDGPGWEDDRRSCPAGDGGNWRVTLPHLHDCDGFFIARWKRR